MSPNHTQLGHISLITFPLFHQIPIATLKAVNELVQTITKKLGGGVTQQVTSATSPGKATVVLVDSAVASSAPAGFTSPQAESSAAVVSMKASPPVRAAVPSSENGVTAPASSVTASQ